MRQIVTTSFIMLIVCLWAISCYAYDVSFTGLTGDTEKNIRARVDLLRSQKESIPDWQLNQYLKSAPAQIQKAVKPFGYYHAQVNIQREDTSKQKPKFIINVNLGEPIRIRKAHLSAQHENKQLPKVFKEWVEQWPLVEGKVLNQDIYEQHKQTLERLAQQHGYFQFEWLKHQINIDETRTHADIELAFNTHKHAVFGDVEQDSQYFKPALLQRFIRIRPGDLYDAKRIDRLRDDLSTSGYFETVLVRERIDTNVSPAIVHLVIELVPRLPNTYSAKLGFGTDTGPRVQLGWDRHYLSRYGDKLQLGAGAQQQDNEYVFRANYQRPRGNDPGEFWFSRGIISREEEDFRFESSTNNDQIFPELDGQRQQYQIDAGILTEINREKGWPIQQRWFISHLYERFDALDRSELLPEQVELLSLNPLLEPNLEVSQQVTSLGASWTLQHVYGSSFDIQGTRGELRLTGALENAASDISFAQIYLGLRHSRVLAHRHKVLLRAELGYTEVATRDFSIQLDERELDLSISRLPEAYRFKTGGDRTIRGYGFESLSNNRIGSNHLLTASAEYEYRVAEEWSVASFYDIGNAFNRFSQRSLRHGVGVGLRWYSLIGPVRLDLARGLDEPSEQFRIHITIGSTLF